MRTMLVLTAGVFVGYALRSRRNQAMSSVAHRIVDAVFGQPAAS